jgi:flagellar hook-length control protein FliK
MVGQLSPLPAPLINPEVYQLSKQGATAPLVEEYRLPIQIIGEGVASGQNPRAEVRPLGGATVVAPLELDQAMPAVIRNVGVGPDQPVTKSFLDAGIQSRQAQLLGSGVESNTAISESKIGLDLSQAKMPAANFATNLATTAAPISGAMALPVGQTDGAAALKMTAVSTMTMAPGEPSWNNEFAARVSVVVKNGLQEASLQLNPPELGRLDVKISTDGDQTKIVFNVQNGAAKDAIELAMPRLREMLEQSGLQLAHSDVSDQSAFQRHDSEQAGNVVSNFAQDTIAENSETSLFTRAVVSPDALVDYYI